ncbi:unnamed protein product [Paramecium pentaurelia]|uniref:Uncharacterized protein n=1 Tax=Paramecium pentaurelia TaxID=43138 RepID=A0A8S1XQC5_9CILI|nr:unnamed protein product [Paramecium pentaurelia]
MILFFGNHCLIEDLSIQFNNNARLELSVVNYQLNLRRKQRYQNRIYINSTINQQKVQLLVGIGFHYHYQIAIIKNYSRLKYIILKLTKIIQYHFIFQELQIKHNKVLDLIISNRAKIKVLSNKLTQK